MICAVEDAEQVTGGRWMGHPDGAGPRRRVQRLLADPDVAGHAGRTMPVDELAEEYGFNDLVPVAAST